MNVALLFISLIFFCAVIELIFRFFYGPPFLCTRHEKIAETENGGIGYVLLKNLNMEYAGKKLITNSVGLRDCRVPRKTDNGIQILALGDSYTFGYGVELEESYPAILERLLNDNVHADKYEVINAGIPGYNTEQELELLRRIIPYYSPKIIIVGFTPNDIWGEISGGVWMESFKVITGNKWLLSVGMFLRYNSSFVTQFCRYYKQALIKYIAPRHNLLGFNLTGHYDMFELDAARKALKGIQKIAEDNGSEIIIFILPPLINWDAYPHQDIHNNITRFCADNGIQCIDLLKELSRYGSGEFWVAPCDEHYNPKANKLAAGLLFNHIINVRI